MKVPVGTYSWFDAHSGGTLETKPGDVLTVVAPEIDYAARGYRRVSSAHRVIARIDRADWVEFLCQTLHKTPAHIYGAGIGAWENHYRRVHSKDTVEGLSEEAYKKVPCSDGDPVGFVPPSTRRGPTGVV